MWDLPRRRYPESRMPLTKNKRVRVPHLKALAWGALPKYVDGRMARREFRALVEAARAGAHVTVNHDYFASGEQRGSHVNPKDCRGCRFQSAMGRLGVSV